MISKITKLLVVFIFGLSYTNVTFGQKIDTYDLSLTADSPPMGGRNIEVYSKLKGKVVHTATESKAVTKKRVLKNNLEIEKIINRLDSLFRLTEFRFTVKKSIIDNVKSENEKNSYNKIPAADIDRFFSNGNTVTLKLNDIKPNEMDPTLMDGKPFSFNLQLQRPGKEIVEHKFRGNFVGVFTEDIRKWIPVYLCYRQTKFFETMPMGKYFSDENLVNILMRFIEWGK